MPDPRTSPHNLGSQSFPQMISFFFLTSLLEYNCFTMVC